MIKYLCFIFIIFASSNSIAADKTDDDEVLPKNVENKNIVTSCNNSVPAWRVQNLIKKAK